MNSFIGTEQVAATRKTPFLRQNPVSKAAQTRNKDIRIRLVHKELSLTHTHGVNELDLQYSRR